MSDDNLLESMSKLELLGIIRDLQQKVLKFEYDLKSDEEWSDKYPDWVLHEINGDAQYKHVLLREWEERGWRDAQGWHGNDLIHNRRGKAVRVLDYYFKKQDESLVGVVHFGPDAESHRGLCHGGAMTSVMDDLLGHLSFLAEGTPWCGATVQVNVKLKKPVKVGQYLRISGRVVKREGSKVFISGKLEDENGNEYATLDGLSISGVKLSDIEDHVSSRTFIEVDTKLKCSGWDIDSK